MEKNRKSIFWLFMAYCITMLALLFIRTPKNDLPYFEMMERRYNLVPFKNTLRYISRFTGQKGLKAAIEAIANVFGNIILFIPFGWFVPVLWPGYRKYIRLIALSFLVILSVETTQIITLRGFFDVDDIILNLLGISIGYYFFYKSFNNTSI